MRRALLLSIAVAAAACSVDSQDPVASAEAEVSERRPPRLPGPGSESPWGGSDPARWRPEAALANAASAALDDAWADPDTRDAVVAVPVTMLGSELFPYGDGQSNAAPTFNGWHEPSRPPVVATLVRGTRESRIVVRFDRALPISHGDATLRFRVAGATHEVGATLAIEPSGDRIATWQAPPELRLDDPAASSSLAVSPGGWRGGFPLSFTHPTKKAAHLAARTVTFADGRGLLDREGLRIREDEPRGAGPVAARVRDHAFSARYNQQGPGRVVPYETPDVHASFPFGGSLVRTGVGGGRTWVADERPAGYKAMIQCFDPRRTADETAFGQGVPSGSGWHRIGDRAETVVDDLEDAPLLVGLAAATALSPTEVAPDGYAWGLAHVATFRWLMPGEAFVAVRGTFHWFAFSHDSETCAEILVSPESAALEGFEP